VAAIVGEVEVDMAMGKYPPDIIITYERRSQTNKVIGVSFT
jgi:hypothetical protein